MDIINMAMGSSPGAGEPPPRQNYEAKQGTRRLKNLKKTSNKSSDYAEKSQKNSGKKKSSKSKAVPKKTPVNAAKDVDANAVPNPNPAGGPVSAQRMFPSGAVYTGVLPVVLPASTHPPGITSGFSPLPPLSAFATATSLAATSTGISASSSQILASPTSHITQQQSHSTVPKHLPTVIIVLLAVGAAFFLVGCFIIFRVWSRPQKHQLPTPSLPILQDNTYYEEEKVNLDADEESLFGGKERTSARPGSNGLLLNWTQYPQTSVTKPAPTLEKPGLSPNLLRRKSPQPLQNSRFLSPNLGATANNNASRSTNRLSALSMSVYPGSPVSTSGNLVGLAMTGSPLTADGMPVLQRSNTKNSTRRMSMGGKAARQSLVMNDKLHVPSTYGTSDLYGGVVTANAPTTPKIAVTSPPSGPGRARVKAPYAPGSFLRTSTNAPESTAGDNNPFEDSQYVLPPLSPMMKSEDRRERDTRALASAMGLGSPVPGTPGTIYPDDSVTLAGGRRRSRSEVMSPTVEASARLGKLMLADFQSMASLPSVRNVHASSTNNGNGQRVARTVSRKRVEDKPPRVPSPPPLPSLAEMAMQRNQADFEDYRSPTYSIYGLYEADRKSRNTNGEHGY